MMSGHYIPACIQPGEEQVQENAQVGGTVYCWHFIFLIKIHSMFYGYIYTFYAMREAPC